MSKTDIDVEMQVPDELLRELLTDSEWRMVKQRLRIINLLKIGKSVRSIADEVGVGTDTVVRVSKIVRSSENLKSYIQKDTPPQMSSKWVFGKTEE
jgi:Trp operon repressor